MRKMKMTPVQKKAYISKLDKFANDVEANFARMQLTKADALKLAYDLDKLSDQVEAADEDMEMEEEGMEAESSDTRDYMKNFFSDKIILNGAGPGQGTGLSEFEGTEERPSNKSGRGVRVLAGGYNPVTKEGEKMARALGRVNR